MSETFRGSAPDKFSRPDEHWIKDMPRHIFAEVEILLYFYLDDKTHVGELGDAVFKLIHADTHKYHFHLALDGMLSYSAARTSLLSRFLTSQTSAPKASKWLSKVIEPRLSVDITPKTKVLTKSQVLKELNATAPPPKQLERVVARQVNPKIRIVRVTGNEGDIDSEMKSDNLLETVKSTYIKEASKLHHQVNLYHQQLLVLFNRAWGKVHSMLGKGKHRSKELNRLVGVLKAGSIHVKPLLLLFVDKSVKQLEVKELLDNDSMKIPGVVEKLLYVQVANEHDTAFSALTRESGAKYFVAMQSCSGHGSFNGKSKLKFAIVSDLLVTRVSLSLKTSTYI